MEVLVQWEGLFPDDTSWELWEKLCEDFHLEDKVNLHGPTDDMKQGETEGRSTQAEVQNTQSRVQKQNQEAQIAARTKRTLTSPSYLSDYV